MRHAVPKSTETRPDKRAGKVFIDLAGPLHVESLAGSRFAMLCVDEFSRYKIVALYNGVAEYTLGLLHHKTVALLRGVTEGARERLYAKAMAYACDMSNKCVTDSLGHDKTPYEMRHG